MTPGDLDTLISSIAVDPVAMILVGLALLVLVILIIGTFFGYFRVLLNIALFAYPVARVKAVGNPFVTRSQAEALAESGSFSEFLTVLMESGAGPQIPENTTLEGVEKILETWHYQEIQKMGASLPDAIRPFFSAYIGIFEGEQIIAALRSVYSAGIRPGAPAHIAEIGCITPALIDSIGESTDIKDLISRLQGTPYVAPLAAAFPEYEETSSIGPLESAVRLYVMKNLNASKGRVDPAVLPAVLAFTGVYADVTNILTLLRAKSRNLPLELVSLWLVPGGAYYEEWRLRQIYESARPADILRQLEGSEYFHVLEPLVQVPGSSIDLGACELTLDRYMLAKATGLSSVYHLTGGPLIKFAVSRKYEMRNLRIFFHTGFEMRTLEEALPNLVLQEAVS
ncbi:V/A-type H+-transporting ATPase subunit C [Methanolinea mesophila]|uniref:V-type ATPase subunit n=1 Tax=Methanolinea mesophila TaxID=547055 RepID=UPI001AE3BCF9|nr:V-type ATPase subunit [Methanolinea mesophila]MBP1927532.1 V/A-type H+-transporting ATPase subunit C [Methanolinea mesophila]